ncbi:adenosylcobinamide-phosphate guanylyltransferase [Methanohalophilus levihalophilus]|uniref:NTP transferase domain-containing protein n=1 Tax=Methanohalophilus levihalophilus TaxID=1431282 RepID=UPI001AE790BF|nr:NTP transferase domain-containing protein [Methanohalophilus levihalophilus]MBP2030187.1 adenosylcobinamide-phosphate guanylyltransferase [Methanohalophilus levihalophilus]
MDAVVMAGGQGLRLGMGEKPVVDLLGKPLISYVIDSLEGAEEIGKIYVTVSPFTPTTEKVVGERYEGRIKTIETGGDNYVGDMIFAVESVGIEKPVMIIMSDLPLITPSLIDQIVRAYYDCGKPSMSVFIPLSLCKKVGLRPDTVFNWEGELIVPAGINILDGKDIREEQEYHNFLLDDPQIAININTAEDLKYCSDILCEKQKNNSPGEF